MNDLIKSLDDIAAEMERMQSLHKKYKSVDDLCKILSKLNLVDTLTDVPKYINPNLMGYYD